MGEDLGSTTQEEWEGHPHRELLMELGLKEHMGDYWSADPGSLLRDAIARARCAADIEGAAARYDGDDEAPDPRARPIQDAETEARAMWEADVIQRYQMRQAATNYANIASQTGLTFQDNSRLYGNAAHDDVNGARAIVARAEMRRIEAQRREPTQDSQ